jgi:hypothetical protein
MPPCIMDHFSYLCTGSSFQLSKYENETHVLGVLHQYTGINVKIGVPVLL